MRHRVSVDAGPARPLESIAHGARAIAADAWHARPLRHRVGDRMARWLTPLL